jgi:hypothetical protein
MSYRKLSKLVIQGILIILFVVGCGAPAASPTPIPPTLTSTPTPFPTFTPTITPTPVPSLSGRVTDAATGKGIAGARIEAQLAGCGDWECSTNADSNGNYAFFGLSTGDYVLRVTAPGYAREYYDNVNPSHEATLVHVAVGQWTSDIDFDLTEGGSISGTIYESDGVTPISDALVSVLPDKYVYDDGFNAITINNGNYTVTGLALGSYKVQVEAPTYARKYFGEVYCWPEAQKVTVIPPNNTSDINIRLEQTGSISGHVFMSDGLTPVSGAQVFADLSPARGCQGFDAQSNADGSYSLANLPPAKYTLGVQNAVGLAAEFYKEKPSRQTANILSIAAGQNVTGLDFTLEIGAPIRGHVYDEATRAPISGAQIVTDAIPGTATLPDGSYEIWVGTGCYRVGIGGHGSAPGYVQEYWDNHYDRANADPVCVTAPSEVSEIDLYLAHAGSISGYVYEEDGATPLPGASVYAFPVSGDHPGAGANTEADGSYTIQGLPSGKYRVQVTASGHASQFYDLVTDEAAATEVTVKAPDDTPGIDFALGLVSE